MSAGVKKKWNKRGRRVTRERGARFSVSPIHRSLLSHPEPHTLALSHSHTPALTPTHTHTHNLSPDPHTGCTLANALITYSSLTHTRTHTRTHTHTYAHSLTHTHRVPCRFAGVDRVASKGDRRGCGPARTSPGLLWVLCPHGARTHTHTQPQKPIPHTPTPVSTGTRRHTHIRSLTRSHIQGALFSRKDGSCGKHEASQRALCAAH